VLLIGEGEMPSGVWQQADEVTGGAIDRALKAAEFKGVKGRTCTILAPGAGLSRVVAVGLGKPADLTAHVLSEAGGHVAAAVLREPAASVATAALQPAQAAEVALGAALRAYRFDRYRTKEKAEDKPKLRSSAFAADPPRTKSAWESLHSVAKGVFPARDLVSEPPNGCTRGWRTLQEAERT
jgi:leucyl aminopeptidase